MAIKFVQARHYTRTSGRQIDYVVIHDMETPEDSRRAENVAAWFAGPTSPKASPHYNCDDDSTVQSVRDQDIAYHAPGVNHNGIGIENAGRAKQTRAEWLDKYSHKMLREQTAPLTRWLCVRYGIPIRFVDAAGLRRGERGITTHLEVSRAFKRSSHWDPGYNFPMDVFLGWVQGSPVATPTPAPNPVPVDNGILDRGDTGQDVKDWQTLLVGAGHKLTVDGDFGPATEAATKAFQKVLGVTPDGAVGPATRTATAKLLAWLAGEKNRKSTPKVPPFPATTREGSNNLQVAGVQARLNEFHYNLVVDGDFGPATARAVKDFQEKHGLAVDGIVGPNTWTKMWTATS